MDRTILHCDLNGFFASVELLSHPELKDKPVAVCGDPKNRHGIILAKNEPAKKFNIKTAETVWQAKKKCPELVFLPPHHDLYKKYSKKVNEIYLRYTNQVEPFGIDESWLDVTGSRLLFGDGKTIADTLRSVVKNELGLTISVGVSFNKVFAKLGSDYKKPDATTVISKENFKAIVYPLPVSDLLYVGKSVFEKLHTIGVNTIGDLAACKENTLYSLLGKHGKMLYDYANGNDDSPVLDFNHKSEVKSIGNGTTFSHDLTNKDEICRGVMKLCETVSARLINAKLKANCVQVSVKYADFKVKNRQTMLSHPIFSFRDIYSAAMQIIKSCSLDTKPIRLITITASSLCDINSETQLSIFDEENKSVQKSESLAMAIDKLNKKYGKNNIHAARTTDNSD